MLAPGWEALESADGTYYFNEATGETSWDFPAAPAAGLAPAFRTPHPHQNCFDNTHPPPQDRCRRDGRSSTTRRTGCRTISMRAQEKRSGSALPPMRPPPHLLLPLPRPLRRPAHAPARALAAPPASTHNAASNAARPSGSMPPGPPPAMPAMPPPTQALGPPPGPPPRLQRRQALRVCRLRCRQPSGMPPGPPPATPAMPPPTPPALRVCHPMPPGPPGMPPALHLRAPMPLQRRQASGHATGPSTCGPTSPRPPGMPPGLS